MKSAPPPKVNEPHSGSRSFLSLVALLEPWPEFCIVLILGETMPDATIKYLGFFGSKITMLSKASCFFPEPLSTGRKNLDYAPKPPVFLVMFPARSARDFLLC